MTLTEDSSLDSIVKKIQKKRFSVQSQNLREKLCSKIENVFVECGRF